VVNAPDLNDVDPRRRDLLEEFMRAPIGRHSPDLQRLLNVLRSPPWNGGYVLVCTRPHREWMLAQLRGIRGVPPVVVEAQIFNDINAAERAVFQLRWERLTGEALSSHVATT
jgi:hypothetical protein